MVFVWPIWNSGSSYPRPSNSISRLMVPKPAFLGPCCNKDFFLHIFASNNLKDFWPKTLTVHMGCQKIMCFFQHQNNTTTTPATTTSTTTKPCFCVGFFFQFKTPKAFVNGCAKVARWKWPHLWFEKQRMSPWVKGNTNQYSAGTWDFQP